ncbi:MAG: hypothetical protein ACOC2W_01465 [bacterium]
MTKEEIKYVMEKEKSIKYINEYKKIWEIATGKKFKGCMCKGGLDRLYKLCYNYYKNNYKLLTL